MWPRTPGRKTREPSCDRAAWSAVATAAWTGDGSGFARGRGRAAAWPYFPDTGYPVFDNGARHWQTFRAMPRKKDPEKMTAREHIADILQWAERQQFRNIAASLRRVLALLDREKDGRS